MAAPTAQGSQTGWSRYTFGRLVELCLRQCVGVSNAAHASPDAALPAASPQEIAVVQGFVIEALTELQEQHDAYWPLSEATVMAEESAVTAGTYPAVLLPVDFGQAVEDGFHVGGWPVPILTTGQYNRARVPDSLGGGINLTLVEGAPPSTPYMGRIAPAEQALDDEDANDPTADWRMALWLYPLQTAAWSLECSYRATARNYSGDTDAIRLPNRMLRVVTLFVSARVAEFNKDLEGAIKAWALYDRALLTIESLAPSREQTGEMVFRPPVDGG